MPRKEHNALDKPYSVYEVHLGSWKRHYCDNSFLATEIYQRLLVSYVKETGFTHIEFIPIMVSIIILRAINW
jgi:1,4-alpha-glucan branching enzyme